jgi:exodeoxyribonuclease VII large subunit
MVVNFMQDTQTYSVSEVNHAVKLLLEEALPFIWVEGEISNFKAHYSGHYYFSLKDANAQISAVIWKSRLYNIPYDLEDGMQIRAYGSVRVYEKSGRYQLDISRVEPAGAGKLQQKFEQLKRKLNSEGLFEAQYKKGFPKFPNKIGVVTSSTGAAVKDIINVLNRRAPNVEIVVRSAQVQGASAAADIAEAIEDFNHYKKVDLLIVGRGGGSLEDLWAFNEEVVARAIFASDIPVISAVGHEIDFTIADFVADLRAPTPSAAAEMAVPDYLELKKEIKYSANRINYLILNKIVYYREKIISLQKSYGLNRPIDFIRQYAMQVDDLNVNLQRQIKQFIQSKREKIKQLALRLNGLSPKSILSRGYSISFVGDKVVRQAMSIKSGDELVTELYDGEIYSTVIKIKKEVRNG